MEITQKIEHRCDKPKKGEIKEEQKYEKHNFNNNQSVM